MTSQDLYVHMDYDDDDDEDDETMGEFEKGEFMDLVAVGHLNSDSQTDGSNTAGQSSGTQNQKSSEDDPTKNAYGKKRERPKTSIVHEEMTVITLPDGTRRRKCNWCGARYILDKKSYSTSSALKHLVKCDKRKLAMKSQGKKENQLTQKRISVGTFGDDDTPCLETWEYNHALVREIAAHMILGHEFPFSIMEGVIFNRFLRAIYPGYIRITRHTVKADCEAYYEGEKLKMKKELVKVDRVGLTTDLWWSGEQKIGYMTVTGHFIDSNWKLHKRVLCFTNVPPPHTGEVLARELISVMDKWRIKDKVVSITVDNASANDSCITRLKDDFTNKKSLVLGGRLFHVRCCAHILNLLVQDGLDVIKPVIEKIRAGVKYLLNSEKRCKEFGKLVKLLELEGRVQVLDTKTRWNSTWLMLSTACLYKTVWPRVKILLDENIQVTAKPHLQVMAREMKLKYDKYWAQCDILLSIGAFLDPRYKMVFIKWVYPYMYGEDAPKNKNLFLNSLTCLFKEYEKIYKKQDDGGMGKAGNSSSYGRGKKSFEMYLETVQVVDNAKTDLDYYLEEIVLKVPSETKFDVLQWWMVNEPKYPILSKLAKDVLSIPVTTVASEATFSAGKRIIDPKRASMKIETVEMLLCGGDWVKELYGIKKDKEKEKENQKGKGKGKGKGKRKEKGKNIVEEDEEAEKLEFDFSKLTLDESGTASGS